jgi:hypothetical protein
MNLIVRILNYAADRNWTVSLYDGGEWLYKKADPRDLLKCNSFNTTEDGDMLRFRLPDGTKIGDVWLIYEPGEIDWLDCTDNEALNELHDATVELV